MTSTATPTHISSVVVHCKPELMKTVANLANTIEQLEVRASDAGGKLVALLETKNEQEILSIISQLETINGVLTATLVYHEIDYDDEHMDESYNA